MLKFAVIATTIDGDIKVSHGNEVPHSHKAFDTMRAWLDGPLKFRRFMLISSTSDSDGITFYDGTGREMFGADLMNPI